MKDSTNAKGVSLYNFDLSKDGIMKILIIGAGGVIGNIITPAIKQKHEVITAGRSSGDVKIECYQIKNF